MLIRVLIALGLGIHRFGFFGNYFWQKVYRRRFEYAGFNLSHPSPVHSLI